mgnify:CR=1 FL=1
MELWIGALNLGLLYAFMAMGVFITFRIHDFPDITVDGSLTTGAAVAAVLLVAKVNPFIALLAAFGAGVLAGAATAFIHTRLNINGLLAGILVMTGLYSINLHIMGRSNIPLLQQTTIISLLKKINPGMHLEVFTTCVLILTMVLFWLLVSLFFKTDLGIAMRATGNNSAMAAAAGVNVPRMKIFGVALANGMVALSGALVAQYQGFADIGMGVGTVVTGLAAVIIGESILKMRSIYAIILRVILGTVIFRLMIAVALYIGMDPIDLKLLTAAFVLITLIVSKITDKKEGKGLSPLRSVVSSFTKRREAVVVGLVVIVALAAAAFGFRQFRQAPSEQSTKSAAKFHTIGLIQVEDNGLMNISRDSFVAEMEKIGYKNGKNCRIDLQNANGDLSVVNAILDKFIQQKCDLIVTLSTNCTQAAIQKIKDRPIVFATVASPFIIDAGKSDTDHLPNVTGVYGTTPMDKLMDMVRKIKPGKITIGTLYNPAYANSMFNLGVLQKALKAYNDEVTLIPTTVAGSSELQQAALSLAQKDIDAFVLIADNTVYAAFDAVVKVAGPKKIPIFLADVERLRDGALLVLGYDYTSSGIQAAHLVDRILKGENPRNIPFERYTKLTLGVNHKVAKELGIVLPPEITANAAVTVPED